MLSIIATHAAPVPLQGRELTAGWQAYMNQGLQTGAAYAGTGASGESSFDHLTAQTADAFSALNHQGEPAAVTASPSTASTSTAASPTSTIGTDVTSAVATPIVSSTDAFTASILSVVDSLTAALGSPAASSAAPASDAAPASTAAPASPSSSGAASALRFADWQAYMNQGIATGLQYANAGAGVAADTIDLAMSFNDLNADVQTADSFDALNHGAQVQDEEAGGQRRHLTAGWRAYMNQGIATGGTYAGTGASGDSSFDDLNTQTADAFDKLDHQGETGDVATPAASAQGQQHQHYQPKSALGAAVGRLSASLSTGIVGMVNSGVLSTATAAADTAETLAPAQAAAPVATEAAPATVAAAATGATGDALITAQAAAAPPAVKNQWGR